MKTSHHCLCKTQLSSPGFPEICLRTNVWLYIRIQTSPRAWMGHDQLVRCPCHWFRQYLRVHLFFFAGKDKWLWLAERPPHSTLYIDKGLRNFLKQDKATWLYLSFFINLISILPCPPSSCLVWLLQLLKLSFLIRMSCLNVFISCKLQLPYMAVHSFCDWPVCRVLNVLDCGPGLQKCVMHLFSTVLAKHLQTFRLSYNIPAS